MAKKSPSGSLPPAVPLAITPTFRPWTHTSDDRYIYQLSLVLATATVSINTSKFLLYNKVDAVRSAIPFRLDVTRFMFHVQCQQVCAFFSLIMRQGRWSEATEAVFCLQAKKPLPSGSYERRGPNIKIKIIFLHQGCLSDSTS